MEKIDALVIGAGPGGYVAAIRAAQLGLKTAIIEKQWLGGVCLNVGCIPSKSLLMNAEVAYLLRERREEFGFSVDNLRLDYGAAVKRSRQVSDRLTRGVGSLMKKNSIQVIKGTAHLKAADTVIVEDPEGKEISLHTKNTIIATGSRPAEIPNVVVDGKRVITYREAILQETLPKSVLIIGGGPIGLEFGTIWNSYGSEVTIIEMLPRIAPLEDEEVSKELQKSFTKHGIVCLVETRVQKIETTTDGVSVTVVTADGEKVLKAEQALVAIGFVPNSGGLGLEEVGVKVSERKYIEVDGFMATNVPGIWAIGDVTGKLLLAHVASAQGIHCAEAIAGHTTQPINYAMVPRAIYSQPQVASFGYTEAQALSMNKKIKVGKFPFLANGKALGLGETTGFVKILVDETYGEILGAHLLGPNVSELLPELTLAQQNELTVDEIINSIHTHPTLSEAIQEAAGNSSGFSINI